MELYFKQLQLALIAAQLVYSPSLVWAMEDLGLQDLLLFLQFEILYLQLHEPIIR